MEQVTLYIGDHKYIICEELWLKIKNGRIVNGGTFEEV